MLAPQPGRTFPKPKKILSKKILVEEWRASRDATSNPGRPGIDNETAQQFAAKQNSNLDHIVLQLTGGKFGFSKLRTVFIPKPNSTKERVICIPTVRDRLIQRAISNYIAKNKLFPIYHASSFGFLKGRGTREAISEVIKLREKYDWCLKTDIEAFFDRIPRAYLKDKVYRALGSHSLTPLIWNAIDCEAKITNKDKEKFAKQGMKVGVGVRQGMPLSPLLANLALAEFDKQITDNNIEMVRYADDLVLFFKTKEAASNGQKIVKDLLNAIQLNIPEIADGEKTVIVSKSDPLQFLGREIVYLESESKFVARISKKQIEKIMQRLPEEFSFQKRNSDGKNFQETIVDLSKSLSSYLGIYKDAYNISCFTNDLKGHTRTLMLQIFKDLFGSDTISKLTSQGKTFLGLDSLDVVQQDAELDL